MKALNVFTLLLSLTLLCSTTSCVVITKKDNGKHKGWFKNPHNPHNPVSNNPGKAKSSPGNSGKAPSNGKSKGKGK